MRNIYHVFFIDDILNVNIFTGGLFFIKTCGFPIFTNDIFFYRKNTWKMIKCPRNIAIKNLPERIHLKIYEKIGQYNSFHIENMIFVFSFMFISSVVFLLRAELLWQKILQPPTPSHFTMSTWFLRGISSSSLLIKVINNNFLLNLNSGTIKWHSVGTRPFPYPINRTKGKVPFSISVKKGIS